MTANRDTDFGIPIPGQILPRDKWARTAVKKMPPPDNWDWSSLFGRDAPVVLDLGCGNGRYIITSALARPELNHFGCDILPLVIRYATKRANQRGLTNVRLAVIGANELLANYVRPHSVSEIHLYHPQPYKDAAKAERRLITPQFLALVHRALSSRHTPCAVGSPDGIRSVPATEGLFVIQTDNKAYWAYIRRVAPLLFDFEELHDSWSESPHGRTRREIYARQHGMKVFRGQGHPRELTVEQVAEIALSQPPPKFDA
ncbi:MAG TPA: methyltransferase domain-containing protein [Pirellulaceae bacterium]|nr:methyltransferase domain-containing protein [Pirellulaceae bacterium]